MLLKLLKNSTAFKPFSIASQFKEQYESSLNLIHINAARSCALVASIIYTLFYFTGIDQYFNPTGYINFLKLRIIISFFLLIIFCLSYLKNLQRYGSILSITILALCGLGISIMIRQIGYQSNYYVGLNIVYLGSVFFPYGVIRALISCLIIYSFYIIPILLFDMHSPFDYGLFLANNQFQWFTIILAVAINQFHFRTRQTEILNRLTIQKQAEELKVQEEEKRQFIANITHDLKTPLSIISGHTEILRDSYVSETVETKYLDYIRNSVSQINRLLDMLISIALLNKKDEKPNLELFDYPLFVKRFCDHFTVQGEKCEIVFSTEIISEKTVVAMDNIWVERILGNLIQNSFKFTKQGGSIRVKIYKDHEFVFTEVIDTGLGIAAEKLSHVFDLKFQAHDEEKHLGYGLGLAIVKEMISRLGGSIEAFSKVGEGTTMRFSLPIHCDQFAIVNNESFAVSERRTGMDRRLESRIRIIQQQIEQDALFEKMMLDITQFENKAPSHPTILICEDNHGQLHLLIEGLKNNFNLIIAENGKEGLIKLEQYCSKIELILSDVQMPQMDGFEFCENVFAQEKFRHVPFIFLTAFTNKKEQLQGLTLGATDYLQKPFNRSILVEKLNHWLSRRKHEQILGNLVTTLETKNKEISQLRSIVSHEIRNPLMILNSVHYYLSKLKSNYYDENNEIEKKYWDSLNTIYKVIETINKVLDSAKMIESGIVSTSLKKEPVATIMDWAQEETTHLLNSIQLQINNPFNNEYVICDKQLLTQVFVNLIRNASEAIDEAQSKEGLISINVVRSGNHFNFRISDNGTGIPKDRINNLFKYCYTTKKDGTGIGLYFSKHILKIHEGDIFVESQPGAGTTFTVVLPGDATVS